MWTQSEALQQVQADQDANRSLVSTVSCYKQCASHFCSSDCTMLTAACLCDGMARKFEDVLHPFTTAFGAGVQEYQDSPRWPLCHVQSMLLRGRTPPQGQHPIRGAGPHPRGRTPPQGQNPTTGAASHHRGRIPPQGQDPTTGAAPHHRGRTPPLGSTCATCARRSCYLKHFGEHMWSALLLLSPCQLVSFAMAY